MALAVGLTGRPRIEVDGVAVADSGLGELGRVALAYLVSERTRPVARYELAEVLWGEDLPPTWESALRTHITKLRAVLRAAGLDAKDVLVARAGCYQLGLPPETVVDLEAAATALAEARVRLAAGDADEARTGAAAAAAVAGAQFLPGARGAWVEQRQREVRELRLQALEVLAAAALATADWLLAIRSGEEAVAAESFRESAYLLVMNAHAGAGNRGEALRAYERCRAALADELGVNPSAPTEAAYLTLLGHDEPTDLPTGVVTFVLTDIEGSTPLWDAHPSAMAVALARHDELIAAVVRDHQGQLVKSQGEGDATLSVFARASDAAAATMALQRILRRETWPNGLDIRVRAALHTGEAQLRDGDYFGPTLNRAARLRGLASGGTVLASQATAALIADKMPAGASLVSRGRHELKGLARAEDVFELTDAPSTAVVHAVGEAELALPAALRIDAAFAFVNRAAERQLLHDASVLVDSKKPRMVLVAGEPGSGKTRLVTEVAREAHERGVVVLAGRCDEGLALPYQPFVQALHDVIDGIPQQQLEQMLGPLAGELIRLAPDLGTRISHLPPPLRGDPETERYRLFEAVAAWITTMGRHRPVLLVLDDLQWATTPTLLLLRHLLHREHQASLTIIGIYRDTELEPHHPLAALIADLAREHTLTRVNLGGLDAAAVAALVQELGEHALEADGHALADGIHRETEGNAFFAGEVIRHLQETAQLYGSDGGWRPYRGVEGVGIPEGVRHVVGRRVARLSAPCGQALTLAAVVGSDFDLSLLSQVGNTSEDDLLDALEEAQRAKLIAESPDRAGSFVFAHAIVRATLVDELSRTRRLRLHRKIGEAIEELYADDLDQHLPALAHHFIEAAPVSDPLKAAEYALQAGLQAADRLALEEACALFQLGDGVVDGTSGRGARLRCELLIALADSSWNTGQAKPAALRAAEIARGLRSPVYLAQAATVYAEEDSAGLADKTAEDLCQDALAIVGDEYPALRSIVLAALAKYRGVDEGLGAAADDLAREAVNYPRLAETSGAEPPASDARIVLWQLNRERGGNPLAFALDVRASVLLGSARFADRWATVGELETLNGGTFSSFSALRYRVPLHLQLGDIEGFRSDLVELERLLETLPLRVAAGTRDLWAGLLALIEGRFDDVEQRAAEMLLHGGNSPNVANSYVGQHFVLGREQGRSGDFRDLLDATVAQFPGLIIGRAMLAVTLVELGEGQSARDLLAGLAPDDFRGVPRDSTWTGSLAYLAETTALLDEPSHAARLRSLFAPYAGHMVVLAWGVACLGAVDRYLGMLAATIREWDAAEAYYENAMVLEERIESPPLLARTCYWFARMLLARDDHGDRLRADELPARCTSTADRLGMELLSTQARQLRTTG